MKKFLTVVCASGVLLGAGGSAWANLIFDFSGTNATSSAVGSSEYDVTQGGFTIKAFGYNADGSPGSPHGLYWKKQGGDENGLGLINTLNNELTLKNDGTQIANFIQLDVTSVWKTSPFGKLLMNSTTQDESYDVFGSHTQGVIGVQLPPIGGSNLEGSYFTIPSWGQYEFISVAVHPGAPDNNPNWTSQHANDNVLLGALLVCPAIPEPGTVTLVAAALGLLALTGRKKH